MRQGPGGTDASADCRYLIAKSLLSKCVKHAPGQFDSFDVRIFFSSMRHPPVFPNYTLLRTRKHNPVNPPSLASKPRKSP